MARKDRLQVHETVGQRSGIKDTLIRYAERTKGQSVWQCGEYGAPISYGHGSETAEKAA